MADAPHVFFCVHHLSRKGMACRRDPQQRKVVWMLPQSIFR